MKKKEIRYYDFDLRLEKRSDDKPVIIGHGAIFNTLSENLGGFREKIDPAAFDSVMDNDVRALINHDSSLILGRTKSGTLRLNKDDKGLVYEVDVPDTSYARDLMISLERGDITQSSFGFSVEEDSWGEDKDKNIIRTINKVSRLYDVSPVTFPAYPDTDVAKRELDDYVKQKTEDETKKADEQKEYDELLKKVTERFNKLQKWI